MYWNVYRKGVNNAICKVWYPLDFTAEEVHADVSENFDFDVLINKDEED